MTRKLKKLNEVSEPGWYVNINFIEDPDKAYFPEHEAGVSMICRLDDCWRALSGHPINPSELFGEHDRFLGPFDWSEENEQSFY